jgi:hypothetical protein
MRFNSVADVIVTLIVPVAPGRRVWPPPRRLSVAVLESVAGRRGGRHGVEVSNRNCRSDVYDALTLPGDEQRI